MASKEGLWDDHLDTAAADCRFDSPRRPSRPAPEDALRLMRSFLCIRQPAVREAIIELVTTLSAFEVRGE
jgi:hypothetical protein